MGIASGGYYVATDCKRIFASPLTITGSIGVAALRPHITPVFYDKFGLNIQSLIVNGNTTNDMTRPLEGKALELYRRRVDAIYESFVSRVSQGRQLDMEKVKAELAGGRVFSGTDALENGLVDAEGGVMQAIREASRLSNKEGSVDIQVFPRPKPFLERLAQAGTLEDVASGMLARIVKAAVVKAVQESAEEGELVASIGHFL
jgi:ClpP class serine protease